MKKFNRIRELAALLFFVTVAAFAVFFLYMGTSERTAVYRAEQIQGFATVTGEQGVLHSFSPEKAEEYLLVSDTGAYSLTEGLMLCRPGVTQYHCRPMGVQCKCTLFSHASLPVNLRQITLQSPTEITCALRCMVRFSEKSGVIATRRDAPFAYAAFSHRQGIAFAHMENAALFTLPPCHAGAADAAAFHTEGASVAVFETPLHLLPHRPLSLCLTVGHAPDEQAARRMTEAAHHQGVCDALRQVGLFWQEKLERLLLFGGAPELTPLLNRWLPYWARCAERENAASSFPDGLLSLLCCLHTDAPHARQQLLLCAGNQEEPLLLPFLTALYVEITGDKAILQEKLKWPDAPSLLQQCLSLLHSVEFGPHGLPQTAHPLWHPGHYETAESVALGFFLCMAYARFAPLCDGETGKRLMKHRQGLLSRLEQAWLENEYLPGWDGKGLPLAKTMPTGQMCACLACLAGAPREHARMALHHALAHPPSPGLSPLLVMALCNTGACDAAWQMARHALPSFLPGEKAGHAAPA
ncbi:MAG: hypothetical protein IJN44_02825, partial [Clostridia bacterium]|nr:hypothetical protein [Clostridia bacterium]